MKITLMSFSALSFLALLFLTLSSPSAFAATPALEIKYLKKLKHIPVYGGSAQRIRSLLIKLVSLNPKKGQKYLNLGISRVELSAHRNSDVEIITTTVIKLMKKKGISFPPGPK